MRIRLFVIIVSLILSMAGCREPLNQIPELEVLFISNLSRKPFFSWTVPSPSTGYMQDAYQIMVGKDNRFKDPKSIRWNSQLREGESSLQISYDGKALENGMRYFARVRTMDKKGQMSAWSTTRDFVVPIEYPGDWTGEWLTYDYNPESPLPLFRKQFEISDPENIEFARFYIAAPGYYEAYLNGKKIGENVLDPGQTNYEDYTYYTAYGIDPEDLSGENVIGVMLGNGWYNQNVVWGPQMIYGQPVFICQLVILRKDGRKEVFASNTSWKWARGPITWSNVYGGEHYDARLEIENWNRTGRVEGEWLESVHPGVHPTNLYEQFAEPIRIMDEIPVKEIIDKGQGTYVFDFGQNMAGWMRLKIRGERGQEIIIRCTEELDDEGQIDPRSTGVRATKVIQTQKYICRGEEEEIWEPRFTYFGFRYAEVTGLKETPDKEFLTGRVLYSSVPETGSFQCSEKNINRLHQLAQWTIKGNIHSIPTDCPHREKCGWTGDAHAMIRAMIYNFDSQRFFTKYMFDLRSSAREEKRALYFGESFHDRSFIMKPAGIPTMIVPGKRTSGTASPDWGTAMVQIPWYLYLYYGEKAILEDFYPDMKRWVDYVEGIKEEGIIPHGLGDWCPPGGNVNMDCPIPFSSTAFHFLDAGILAQVAELLGITEDKKHYSQMAQELKSACNTHFFDEEHATYGSQTADAMALDLGLVPEGWEKRVAGSIVKNVHENFGGFLNTGIFGLSRVFKVLSENGYEDEVYRLLAKTGKNSFAFMWEKYDVTTLWEVLPCNDTYDEDVYYTSHSHPMQAGFEAWFFSGIAGINPVASAPGFRMIEFKPYLTRQLQHASAQYDSKSGMISSDWKKREGSFTWNIRIPANATGMIRVPTYGADLTIRLNGEEVKILSEDEGFSMIGKYGPGEYLVEWQPE